MRTPSDITPGVGPITSGFFSATRHRFSEVIGIDVFWLTIFNYKQYPLSINMLH